MSLPIKALKNDVYEEKIEVATLTHEGKEYSIGFYPLFKYESIRKLVLELGEFFQKAIEEKVNIETIEEDEIVNYFIIKYFSTGLKFTNAKKAKTVYDEFKIFYNSDLYKVFKEEVFTSQLVQKSKQEVYDELFNNIDLALKLGNKIEKMQSEIGKLTNIKNDDK